jgi:hypothetical protein
MTTIPVKISFCPSIIFFFDKKVEWSKKAEFPTPADDHKDRSKSVNMSQKKVAKNVAHNLELLHNCRPK